MDIEELNKTQIILLTLLVSFVTSIATGIVTVTLLDQAPPAVTQTIHKVVEKTVETVVPAKTTETKVVETQVIVREEENIADAVSGIDESILRFQIGELLKEMKFTAVYLGDNTFVMPLSKNFENKDYSLGGDDKIYIEKIADTDSLTFITASTTKSFKAVEIKDIKVSLGQNIVVVRTSPKIKVFKGIISSLNIEDDEEGNSNLIGIETDIETLSGDLILDMKGELIAFSTGGEWLLPAPDIDLPAKEEKQSN